MFGRRPPGLNNCYQRNTTDQKSADENCYRNPFFNFVGHVEATSLTLSVVILHFIMTALSHRSS